MLSKCLRVSEQIKQINDKIATIKTVTEICQGGSNHCWLKLFSAWCYILVLKQRCYIKILKIF